MRSVELNEKAVRLTIYLGESDRFEGRPAYQAVVDFLRTRGFWGATVTRGILGFGKRSHLHSASVLRLSEDLPMIIEVIEAEEKVRSVVPELSAMVKGGLLTIEDVTVLRHIG
jgi:PII-like signaling protein